MQEISEQQIKKTIADYLRIKKFIVINHRNVGIYKKDTGKYIPLPSGEKGISDIIACSPQGTFVAIEVKKKGGKPTINWKGSKLKLDLIFSSSGSFDAFGITVLMNLPLISTTGASSLRAAASSMATADPDPEDGF